MFIVIEYAALTLNQWENFGWGLIYFDQFIYILWEAIYSWCISLKKHAT